MAWPCRPVAFLNAHNRGLHRFKNGERVVFYPSWLRVNLREFFGVTPANPQVLIDDEDCTARGALIDCQMYFTVFNLYDVRRQQRVYRGTPEHPLATPAFI